MLKDYGIVQGTMSLFVDNQSAINISKNPVQHSRTKHIDIRHHFIRELVEEKNVVLSYMKIEDQLAGYPHKTTRFSSVRIPPKCHWIMYFIE